MAFFHSSPSDVMVLAFTLRGSCLMLKETLLACRVLFNTSCICLFPACFQCLPAFHSLFFPCVLVLIQAYTCMSKNKAFSMPFPPLID